MDDMKYYDEYNFYRAYLEPDENVLWKGKGDAKHPVSAEGIFEKIISLWMFAFIIFWMSMCFLMEAPWFFWIWGTPFFLFTGYAVIDIFIRKPSIRKKTLYVITNKRIIAKRGKKIEILDGKNLPFVKLDARADGSGSIEFVDSYLNIQNNEKSFFKRNFRQNNIIFIIEDVQDVVAASHAIGKIERN